MFCITQIVKGECGNENSIHNIETCVFIIEIKTRRVEMAVR